MKYARKLVDFYLYSSIHISLGASLSVILCYATIKHIPTSDYSLFVFTSTLFLYCIHRVVGIKKVAQFEHEGRFAVIKKFRSHLILYAIVAGAASIYFYLELPRHLQYLLILPAVLSALYVLPIFNRSRRLRDFNFVKIFLIVLNWALVIGVIPYIEATGSIDLDGILYAAEKAFFIFAITLPFDVRDLNVDTANDVATIPSKIGIKKTYNLSFLFISLAMITVFILHFRALYAIDLATGIVMGYLITFILVYLSKGKKDDLYFAGLLDGSILIVALIGIFFSGILDVMF